MVNALMVNAQDRTRFLRAAILREKVLVFGRILLFQKSL